ncbi:hypothetical protein [Geminocystis sp. NIES-3709]|uniref:hypothetical protein n=1 Tax=Geminocystis sp. NIES-3709 TaxID=1617448 RepID=UPI0008269E44|nr:hypothetical protein [Geminocystis sp. NIES-3709]
MLEKLIVFFVCKTKGHIIKTQLVKFLYLADLGAVKWQDKQLTDLDWRYYLNGPWSENIDLALEKLYKARILQEVTKDSAKLIQPAENCLNPKTFGFSKGLELRLSNIVYEWAGANKLDELLEYVYQTEPMISAQQNHDKEEKALLNLRLESQKLVELLGGK